MPTANQISTVVEIAQSGGIDLTEAQKIELPQIIADGLVEPEAGPDRIEKYKVTARGQKLLDSRGVGANES